MADESTNATLSVNTAKAIAELDLVIAKAKEAQALTKGLPPPGLQNAQSVRLPSVPQGNVPGGAAAEMESGLLHKAAAETTGLLGGKTAATARVSGTTAASERALADVPRPALNLKPANAAIAAEEIGHAQGVDRLIHKMTDVEIKRGKLELGPVEVGAGGVELQRNFARKVLPGVAYGYIAYGAVKGLTELTDLGHEAIVEAAKTGRDPFSVVTEKLGHSVGGAIAGFGVSAIKTATDFVFSGTRYAAEAPWYMQLGPAGLALKAGMKLFGLQFDEYGAKETAARIASRFHNAESWLTGAKTVGELNAESIAAGTAAGKALNEAIIRAEYAAQANANKTAEQLFGLGFPGTRQELRDLALHQLQQGEEWRELQELKRNGRPVNGATHNGE
jgi:hypothetical protein